MADTLSFRDAEKLIRENPQQADALAFEAQKYFESHPGSLPTDIPKSVLDGKAISEAYSYLREEHENLQMSQEGGIDPSKLTADLAEVPLLAAAFFVKPKIMEDDRDYQKLKRD